MSPDWSITPSTVPHAKLTDPQTLNLYGYVRNNPIRYSDLDGHKNQTKFEELAYESVDTNQLIIWQKRTETIDITDEAGNVVGQKTVVTITYAEYGTRGGIPSFRGGSQTSDTTVKDTQGNVVTHSSSNEYFSRDDEVTATRSFSLGVSTAYEVFAGNTRLEGNVKYIGGVVSAGLATWAIAGEAFAAKAAFQAKDYGTALKDIGKAALEAGREVLIHHIIDHSGSEPKKQD
jgi:hypothetical protein